MHKIDLASYAPGEGAYLRHIRESSARTPREWRAFACPIDNKCRNAVGNTESENRSVQILDLYPRLASTDRVSERKIRGRIFRPANTWCNNLFIFTETL